MVQIVIYDVIVYYLVYWVEFFFGFVEQQWGCEWVDVQVGVVFVIDYYLFNIMQNWVICCFWYGFKDGVGFFRMFVYFQYLFIVKNG